MGYGAAAQRRVGHSGAVCGTVALPHDSIRRSRPVRRQAAPYLHIKSLSSDDVQYKYKYRIVVLPIRPDTTYSVTSTVPVRTGTGILQVRVAQ